MDCQVKTPLITLMSLIGYVTLTKINGVSEDAIKLRLFPMSLADKAHQWEKSLPHGTITTWDECKKAFLAKFFSTGRTAKLRSEIRASYRGTMRLLLRLGRGSRLHKSVPTSWLQQ
ncbi:unnamed protein product [Microthlaspi erraticum]|uniref:Retrotransposon gag domain-containing protein n=1 Tax=Microthlaspi erraticum TaxID=1685480 RepID=A0A6D2IZP1_9BRAS|nr:unnamed protein product [Microthlaspi erraticum]